jgi:hypothetical protein
MTLAGDGVLGGLGLMSLSEALAGYCATETQEDDHSNCLNAVLLHVQRTKRYEDLVVGMRELLTTEETTVSALAHGRYLYSYI